MAPPDPLETFIASSFRSVWALELLLLLKREDRGFPVSELVDQMRASQSVIETALDSLVAAGLAGSDGTRVRYMPVSADMTGLVEQAEQLYRSKPSHVRRLIISSSNKALTAFSDAFRLKD